MNIKVSKMDKAICAQRYSNALEPYPKVKGKLMMTNASTRITSPHSPVLSNQFNSVINMLFHGTPNVNKTADKEHDMRD